MDRTKVRNLKMNHSLEEHHELNFAIATLESMLADVVKMREEADPMERLSLALIIESYKKAIEILKAHRTLDKKELKEDKQNG